MIEQNELIDDFLAIAELECITDDEDEETNKETIIKRNQVTNENEDEIFLGKISQYSQNLIPSTSNKINKSINYTELKDTEIHKGDTDSSDDEHNRDFENRKYNECGRDIKHLLTDQKTSENFNRDLSSWKQKRTFELGAKPKQPSSNIKQKSDIFTDPFFGIRISKPLISSAVLQERMSGRTSVAMSNIKQFISKNTISEDWVIAGVIVNKSTVRTSQKGNQYIIWKLSDLKGDIKTISLFLFGNAYKELWKSTIGTVLGVLNPTIMDKKDGSRDEACLSVDVAQRVMIFGQSKDFGICRSKKKDGQQCTAFVNTNYSEYCVYHIKQEYHKLSKRSELQSTFAGRGLTALRNKVLGKNEVFYAGKSYTAIPAKKNQKQVKRDNQLLDSLSELSKSGIVTSQSAGLNKFKAAETLEVSQSQRVKDLKLLRKLNGEKELTPAEKETEIRRNIDKALNINKALLHAEDILKDIDKLEDSHKVKMLSKNENIKGFDFLNVQPSSSTQHLTNLSNNMSEHTPILKSEKTNISNTLFDIKMGSSKLPVLDTEHGDDKKNSPKITTTPKLSNFGTEIDLNSQKSISTPKLSKFTAEIDLNTPTSKPLSYVTKSAVLNIKKPSKKTPSFLEKSILNIEECKELLDKSKIFKNLVTPKLTNFENFDLTSPIQKTNSVRMDKAKLNALKYVQKHGPIKKEDENRKKGVKRFLEQTEDLQEKKLKMADNKFTSQRFKQIMALQSKHTDLLEEADREKEEKYFKKLEVREKMEEKMMTVFKIDCKAVKCLKCKYTNFSASEHCKEERHPLKVFDAVKRFFKCSKCGNRSVSLEIIPLISCTNCGGSKWERTTMMKEKTAHIGEQLSIRGLEEKFVGSINTGGNINLLVPNQD